jgi:hydroxymethylglutaryl-CoA reductase
MPTVEDAMAEKTQDKFREMSLQERIDFITKAANLSERSVQALMNWTPVKTAEGENFLAFMHIPGGIVPQVKVNGRELFVPLVTEEPSVVAAAARGAKAAEKHGGFRVVVRSTRAIGQVQVVGVPASKTDDAIAAIKEKEKELIAIANRWTPHLVAEGGGVLSLTPKWIETRTGPQLIVDFVAECKDAMGANAVSKMAEGMASEIARLTGGQVLGRILSNLNIERVVVCEAIFDKEIMALEKEIDGKLVKIDGEAMVQRIVALSAWADVDQFRATTHNKGIMNGITGVALAVGQDTRAVEAAAHSYAAFNRPYGPLSYFEKNANGDLYGRLEVPIPVGVIGGTINTNDVARAFLAITQCKDPKELAALMAAVGLAENVSSLRMLAGEGISSGHLPLHMKRV